jgi:hypothetical protein
MSLHARVRRLTLPWTGVRKALAIAMMIQQLTPPLGALAAPLSQTGRWTPVGSLGFSGTHVALLREPQSNAAKVFLFGESGSPQTMKFWRFFGLDHPLALPDSNVLVSITHPNETVEDLFCSGHATLPDGKLLLMGGGWVPSAPCRDVYTFDPAWSPAPCTGCPSEPWTDNAAMAVERWYGTASILPDGKVLASAGTMSSSFVAYGGLSQSGGADVTLRKHQPLELSARAVWGDTTTFPLTATGVGPAPLSHRDDYTNGRYPPGREGHVLMGGSILYGGRTRLPGGVDSLCDDVWLLEGSPFSDDTTHSWRLLEQVADPSAGYPTPRTRFAGTWAGVEDRLECHLPDPTNKHICFIHGGLDASGQHVLGDLWKGEVRASDHPFPNNLHYQWVWTRLLPDDPATARYGHTMVFDPGPPRETAGGPLLSGAPYAQLLLFGGRTSVSSPTPMADASKLYAYGVGSSVIVNGVWRVLTPSAPAGAPPARGGACFCPRVATGRRQHAGVLHVRRGGRRARTGGP